jgi:hypothetical protein
MIRGKLAKALGKSLSGAGVQLFERRRFIFMPDQTCWLVKACILLLQLGDVLRATFCMS